MADLMIEVPQHFCHGSFYKKGTMIAIRQDTSPADLTVPFLADILYLKNYSKLYPPEQVDIYIPMMLKQWRSIKELLAVKFEKRQFEGAEEQMKYGIAFAIQWIHWMNGKTVDLGNIGHFDEWKIHPVNSTERIQFILIRPVLYHSFVQLCELIGELEKQYFKMLAVKGKSK
ncbi:YpoC family protein [Cytobacillus gottheilii]|uniref:YpoC-like domain-containing protein n=1 Tax=Cytobacillus gottheilii TaxID=859144 RepID=A0ABX8F727_9BACI|nr:hypothetical protein [Cytobacillus gottheilii]QVY60136.1 hypothetical protein J1899_13985 [Cytobacillus gottheilii]